MRTPCVTPVKSRADSGNVQIPVHSWESTSKRRKGALLCSRSRLSGTMRRTRPPARTSCRLRSKNNRYRFTFPRSVLKRREPSPSRRLLNSSPSSFRRALPSGCPRKRSLILNQGGLPIRIRGDSSHGQSSLRASPTRTTSARIDSASLRVRYPSTGSSFRRTRSARMAESSKRRLVISAAISQTSSNCIEDKRVRVSSARCSRGTSEIFSPCHLRILEGNNPPPTAGSAKGRGTPVRVRAPMAISFSVSSSTSASLAALFTPLIASACALKAGGRAARLTLDGAEAFPPSTTSDFNSFAMIASASRVGVGCAPRGLRPSASASCRHRR